MRAIYAYAIDTSSVFFGIAYVFLLLPCRWLWPVACFPRPIAGGAVLSVRGSVAPKTIPTLAAFAMR
jgi:hypothetical protein